MWDICVWRKQVALFCSPSINTKSNKRWWNEIEYRKEGNQQKDKIKDGAVTWFSRIRSVLFLLSLTWYDNHLINMSRTITSFKTNNHLKWGLLVLFVYLSTCPEIEIKTFLQKIKPNIECFWPILLGHICSPVNKTLLEAVRSRKSKWHYRHKEKDFHEFFQQHQPNRCQRMAT